MSEYTKMTFTLIPEAVAALDAAAQRCGYSRTDTANRALLLYDRVTTLVESGEPLRLTLGDVIDVP